MGQARTVLAGLRWWWRGVTGDDAYDRYVAHVHRVHPGRPVPTKKQFWRDTYEEMERNPKTRCC